jgi:DNA polymerase-3 subunit gamma/tau
MLIKRTSRLGANDLNTSYRPCLVSEFIGQETNCNILRNYLDNGSVPHTQLYTGPPGCGKTTAARIVALGLNCEKYDGPTSKACLECNSCRAILNHNSMDVMEINVGKTGGKDAVTSIINDLPTAPFSSRYKVLIFDEAHKLTVDARDLLLKEIEDGYKHVYYIFCTNEPEKLKSKKKDEDAFLSRCSVMHFGRISSDLLYTMIKNVAEFEGMNYNSEVLHFIADESRGTPRDALVYLNQLDKEGSWSLDAAKHLTGLLLDEEDPNIIELSKSLLGGRWKDSLVLYDAIKKSTPAETIRIAVVGYFIGCLKRSRTVGEGKMFDRVLDTLNQPIYESGKLGDNRFYHYMFKVTDIINGSRRS